MKRIAFLAGLWAIRLSLPVAAEPACPPEARILAAAYPGIAQAVENGAAGCVLVFADGQRLPFSDGRVLNPEQRLADADLAAVLSQPYPQGQIRVPVQTGQEPGRWRNYPLLQAAYGRTKAEVEANLDTVDFLGVPLRFNRNNGAFAALQGVAGEIAADSALMAYLKPILVAGHAGQPDAVLDNKYVSSWAWRTIAGTARLSPHAFGIAVDINNPFTGKPKYWRWRKSGRPVRAIDPVPWKLIAVFERHGFIWGGKWHHFDTMHFEYRPEFFRK